MAIIRTLVVLTIMCCIISCGETGDEEIYILPNNYQGPVFILFNQNDGQPQKHESNARLYEIPADGILRTSFSPNKGWHKPNRYYYTNNGERKEIPYEISGKSIDSLSVRICCQSSGNAKVNPQSPNVISVDYSLFIVGSLKNIDSIATESQRINAASLIKK